MLSLCAWSMNEIVQPFKNLAFGKKPLSYAKKVDFCNLNISPLYKSLIFSGWFLYSFYWGTTQSTESHCLFAPKLQFFIKMGVGTSLPNSKYSPKVGLYLVDLWRYSIDVGPVPPPPPPVINVLSVQGMFKGIMQVQFKQPVGCWHVLPGGQDREICT